MKKEQAIERVEAGLKDLAEALKQGRSDELMRYLEMASRFHRYSFRNVLLMLTQKPDASRVAGYRKWEEFGRNVKKGEKGIAILAPMKRRRKKDSESKDDDSEKQVVILGFRIVYVFDISQTEGDELAEFTRIEGDPGPHLKSLESVVLEHNIELEYESLPPGTLGLSSGGKISIRKDLESSERLGVLVHEFAHELLRHKQRRGEVPKTVRECEAEATAAVVLSALGLDSSKRSADYIQLYQGNTETLAESLEVIQRTATRILESIETPTSVSDSNSGKCVHALDHRDESSTWVEVVVHDGVRVECSECGRFYGLIPDTEPERDVVTHSGESDDENPRVGRADYKERRERRIERLEERACKAEQSSDATYKRAKQMAGCIPFGQPILVGHHSEQRDRRFRERIHDTYGKAFELNDKAKHLRSRASAAESNQAISSDDPQALNRLREKLRVGEECQQSMKSINAAWRRAGKPNPSDAVAWKRVEELLPSETSETLASVRDEMVKPWHIYEAPFAPYALSNNNANNRRIRERIQALERESSQRESSEQDCGFCTRRENVEINRVQLLFPGKPTKPVRDLLKQNGFRWARSEGAWQRQLNDAGRRAADYVTSQIQRTEEVK